MQLLQEQYNVTPDSKGPIESGRLYTAIMQFEQHSFWKSAMPRIFVNIKNHFALATVLHCLFENDVSNWHQMQDLDITRSQVSIQTSNPLL